MKFLRFGPQAILSTDNLNIGIETDKSGFKIIARNSTIQSELTFEDEKTRDEEFEKFSKLLTGCEVENDAT